MNVVSALAGTFTPGQTATQTVIAIQTGITSLVVEFSDNDSHGGGEVVTISPTLALQSSLGDEEFLYAFPVIIPTLT